MNVGVHGDMYEGVNGGGHACGHQCSVFICAWLCDY